MTASGPTVSVIICAYSDDRREQLHRAIASVLAQRIRPTEVVVVIDHNMPLWLRFVSAYPELKIVVNEGPRGLSAARNSGIRRACGDVLAFLDDDAVAAPDWLERMLPHYDDPSVIGVGGKVTPIWQVDRPRWFPEEFQWVVGCSYRGQPEKVERVRNPIGCNMSFRRHIFELIGGFREGIGRTTADAAGCEETELCIRAQQVIPGATILYDPAMGVQHQVTAERAGWQYFRKRCLAEGRSKTLVVKAVGSGDGLASESRYMVRVLPAGVVRAIGEAIFKLDPWALARAGGIFFGLGYTAAGYIGARLASARRQA